MTAVDNETDALRTAMEFVLNRKVTLEEARTVKGCYARHPEEPKAC
jgi:hypothetical protein